MGRRVEAGLFVASLTVYLFTLARSAQWGDSTELALAADSFGIPHPTGYPLYVLLGWIAAHLPVMALPWRVGLLSAVPAACAVVLAYRLMRRFCDPLPAGAAALGFAFSHELWEQSSVPEVYGMHIALAALILLMLARVLEQPGEPRLYALALAGGMGFAHHMQTVYLVPGCVAAVLADARTRALVLRPRVLAKTLATGTLPMLAYGLLWTRGHMDPWLDEAGARSFSALVAHVTGRQFAYRMWASFDLWKELLRLKREVLEQVAPSWPLALPALALATWGVQRLAVRRSALVLGLAVSAATCAGWTAGYNIPDKSAYYLTLYLVGAVAAAAGLAAALERVPAGGRHPVCALLVAIPLLANFALVDRSRDVSLEDYTADIMKLAPAGTVIVTDDLTLWWGFVYRQRALGLDTDKSFVCSYPLRLRWYLPFLRRQCPALVLPAELDGELERRIADIEENGDASGAKSQSLVDEVTLKIVDANLPRHPVLAVVHQTNDELKTWGPFQLQSLGLAYRVAREALPPVLYPTDYAPGERHRSADAVGPDQRRVAKRYALALNRLGILEIQAGDLAKAETLFQRALDYDVRYAAVYTNLGVLYDQHLHQPERTYALYRKFLELAAPDDRQRPVVEKWLAEYESRVAHEHP